MPFYEYQCTHCGHTLEAMQKFTDAPLKKCPHCGKPQLQKLMSAPVFRLKGGGWYETDFKSDQDNKRNLADRPEADASKDTGDKAEPAAKTEPAGKEAAASDAPKPEKSVEKPAEKAATADGGKKAATAAGSGAAGGSGARRASPAKTVARKPAKRPARPALKRSAAKPARGR
jgi:putative FmdB family regulatory protein